MLLSFCRETSLLSILNVDVDVDMNVDVDEAEARGMIFL